MKRVLTTVLMVLFLLAGCVQTDNVEEYQKFLPNSSPSLKLLPEQTMEEWISFPLSADGLIALQGEKASLCLLDEKKTELVFSDAQMEIFVSGELYGISVEIRYPGQKEPQRIKVSSHPVGQGEPFQKLPGRMDRI